MSTLTREPVADDVRAFDNDLVLVALKTPLDVRAVTAAFPADITLDRAIAAMRKSIPAHDTAGHHVLDNVEREMLASRTNLLVVRPEGVVITDRAARLRDIATAREVKTAKGPKIVPAVAVEVQAYASVGGR